MPTDTWISGEEAPQIEQTMVKPKAKRRFRPSLWIGMALMILGASAMQFGIIGEASDLFPLLSSGPGALVLILGFIAVVIGFVLVVMFDLARDTTEQELDQARQELELEETEHAKTRDLMVDYDGQVAEMAALLRHLLLRLPKVGEHSVVGQPPEDHAAWQQSIAAIKWLDDQLNLSLTALRRQRRTTGIAFSQMNQGIVEDLQMASDLLELRADRYDPADVNQELARMCRILVERALMRQAAWAEDEQRDDRDELYQPIGLTELMRGIRPDILTQAFGDLVERGDFGAMARRASPGLSDLALIEGPRVAEALGAQYRHLRPEIVSVVQGSSGRLRLPDTGQYHMYLFFRALTMVIQEQYVGSSRSTLRNQGGFIYLGDDVHGGGVNLTDKVRDRLIPLISPDTTYQLSRMVMVLIQRRPFLVRGFVAQKEHGSQDPRIRLLPVDMDVSSNHLWSITAKSAEHTRVVDDALAAIVDRGRVRSAEQDSRP